MYVSFRCHRWRSRHHQQQCLWVREWVSVCIPYVFFLFYFYFLFLIHSVFGVCVCVCKVKVLCVNNNFDALRRPYFDWNKRNVKKASFILVATPHTSYSMEYGTAEGRRRRERKSRKKVPKKIFCMPFLAPAFSLFHCRQHSRRRRRRRRRWFFMYFLFSVFVFLLKPTSFSHLKLHWHEYWR